MVGTSGAANQRALAITPKALILPLRTCGKSFGPPVHASLSLTNPLHLAHLIPNAKSTLSECRSLPSLALLPRAGDKEIARQRTLQLFPAAHALLARKKDHQRAEAALIALTMNGGAT